MGGLTVADNGNGVAELNIDRPVGMNRDLGPLVRFGLLVGHRVELLDGPAGDVLAPPARLAEELEKLQEGRR